MNLLCLLAIQTYIDAMKAPQAMVEIPVRILESVDTLDELEDWLTLQNPALMRDLKEARAEDRAGKFKAWKPRHIPCPTKSK